MTDLERFRDHCRTMANLQQPVTQRRPVPGHGWQDVVVLPVPIDSDRALWSRLADEIDEHLDVDHPVLELEAAV